MKARGVLPQCVASIAALGVLAQGNGFGDNGYANGPHGVNFTYFFKLLDEQPNATGVYSIAGPPLTDSPRLTPQPPQLDDGWSWQIDVKADIPLSLSSKQLQPEEQGKYFVGTQIALQVPPSLQQNISSGWELCIMSWPATRPYSDQLREDDGTCSSVLSDDCRKAIADDVAKTWKEGSSGSSRCTCPTLADLQACGDPPATFKSGCLSRVYNATQINNSTKEDGGPSDMLDWTDRRVVLQPFGGFPVEKGNMTAYNETGSLAWPFLVAWGLDSDEHDPISQMTCVRAANATEGSQVPGPIGGSVDDESSASRGRHVQAFPASLVLLAGVAVALL